MMKKEARLQAEKIYLNAKEKITNREIAKALNVNALTVGRWKREDDWDATIKAKEQAATKEKAGLVRKKEAREKAIMLYMQAGGNITNKELAKKQFDYLRMLNNAIVNGTVSVYSFKDKDSFVDSIVNNLDIVKGNEKPVAQPKVETKPKADPLGLFK